MASPENEGQSAHFEKMVRKILAHEKKDSVKLGNVEFSIDPEGKLKSDLQWKDWDAFLIAKDTSHYIRKILPL